MSVIHLVAAGRSSISALFKDGKAIVSYGDLEAHTTYTLEMVSSIPARVKSMERAFRHPGSRREDKLALAIAQDCGLSAAVRPDLRIIKGVSYLQSCGVQ